MAMTADQVVVRLRAETAQYQQNMRNAAVAATQFDLKASTAIGNLGNAFTGLGQGSVKMSADVSKALDNMASNARRSAVRHEQALDRMIQKQLEFGRSTEVRPGNLPGLGGTSWGADPFKPVVASADKATKAVNNMQFSTANLAAQFNDIGVTAAMGMNPLLIALQQGTQLSQAFAGQRTGDVVRGLGSAFAAVVSPVSLLTIGLVAATAAVAQWAIGAVMAGRDTKSLEERIKGLNDAVSEYRTAAERASIPTRDLADKYGVAATRARELLRHLQQIARIDAASAMQKGMTDVLKTFDDLIWRVERYDELVRRGEGQEYAAIRQIRKLFDEFGLTIDQARTLKDLLTEHSTATTLAGQADAVHQIAVFLTDAAAAANYQNDALNKAAKAATEASLASMELRSAINDSSRAAEALASIIGRINFSGAISSAQGLGRQIGSMIGQAQALMSVLGQAGQRNLDAQAQSELLSAERDLLAAGKSRVEVERELAGIRERQTLDAAGVGLPVAMRNKLIEDAKAEAGAIAQTREEIQKLNEARTAASKGGGGGGGSSAPSPQQRAVERFDDRILKEIEGLRAEAEALASLSLGYDEYGNAVSAARKEAEMLQDLQNKGVTLTPELRDQVKALAQDWREAADAASEARERHQEFQQNLEAFRSSGESAFSGLISGAHGLSGALSIVAKKLADLAASSAFDILWGGVSRGGFMNRIVGGGDALTGALRLAGARAGGGPVQAGRPYLVNENTPRSEVFVPSRSGAILNVQQAQAAVRGMGGAGNFTFAPTINVGGNVTQDDIARIHGVMEIERRNFVQNVRRAQIEIGQRYD